MSSTHDIITLHNIDSEDFEFSYNKSEGNPPYIIPAGEVARFPKWLADHALKHLINKIMMSKDESISNQSRRNELGEQIVVGSESLRQEKELSEDEKIRIQVEELNKPSTLEMILKKRKEEKDKTDKTIDTKQEIGKKKEETKVEEKFEGLEEKVEPKAKPTRKKLYDYAENTLKMEMDDKTIKKLDKLKVTELMKELQYEE